MGGDHVMKTGNEWEVMISIKRVFVGWLWGKNKYKNATALFSPQ